MLSSNHPVFRKNAMQHYMRGREKDTLPVFINVPLSLVLWFLLGIVLATGCIAWYQQVPTFVIASGVVLEQNQMQHLTSDQSNVALFVPWSPMEKPQVGQSVALRFGSHGEQVTGLITRVEHQQSNPASLCQKFELSQDCLLLIRQPSITLYVRAQELSPSVYAGTPITADVQIGSQRVLSLFPGIGWLAGR
ncbi:hypothetical protein [Ktedonospora formicarum]|uniref:Uncharacterized protein n=1 Tax=Ktedonospora formicarum TaxID=2778364 RepID=A0A8J3I3M4_9CHLR|nr:hypothetical protein [Ktedonospora formicarum]GHO45393.1 hypothetical protein KSX_35560 [Ktedonospora formicarum]